MSDCGVCFDWSDCIDDPWSDFTKEDTTATEDLKCCECDDAIPKGVVFELVSAQEHFEDEDFTYYHICLACRDVRDALNCTSALMVGALWDEVRELLPHLTTACVGTVASKEGREKLLAYWREWKGI